MDCKVATSIRWFFALGLAIALLMIYRSQVAGDALALLTKGWLFAEGGVWVPFGNPAATSTPAHAHTTSTTNGIGITRCRIARTKTSSPTCHWSHASGTCPISTWHNKSPFEIRLSSCQFCTTFWTTSCIARLPDNMRDYCCAVRAYTISARSCGERSTHSTSALPLPSPHAAACAASLACRPCTISSGHNIHPFCN